MGHESLPQADRPDLINDSPRTMKELAQWYMGCVKAWPCDPLWLRMHQVTESSGKEQTNSRESNG
jgi:hypothetical protein